MGNWSSARPQIRCRGERHHIDPADAARRHTEDSWRSTRLRDRGGYWDAIKLGVRRSRHLPLAACGASAARTRQSDIPAQRITREGHGLIYGRANSPRCEVGDHRRLAYGDGSLHRVARDTVAYLELNNIGSDKGQVKRGGRSRGRIRDRGERAGWSLRPGYRPKKARRTDAPAAVECDAGCERRRPAECESDGADAAIDDRVRRDPAGLHARENPVVEDRVVAQASATRFVS